MTAGLTLLPGAPGGRGPGRPDAHGTLLGRRRPQQGPVPQARHAGLPGGAGGRGAPARTARPASAPPPRVDFRPDVEGLRAVAVLLVVAFHAGLAPLDGGYVGVDVFFVISGFLITGLLVDELLRTGTVSITNFYSRRVRRLLPAACTVLIATALVFPFVVPAIDQPSIAADVVAATLWFANWHFAFGATDYFAATTEHSPVLHFWSLSVEEQFYLVWPLLVLLVAGRSLRRRRGAAGTAAVPTGTPARGLLAPGYGRRDGRPATVRTHGPAPRRVVRRVALALVPLGLLSFVISVLTAGSGPFAYFGVHTRAWELAAGAAVALARGDLHRLSPRAAACLGWVGLVLVVVPAVAYDATTPFPGWAAVVPVLGAAAVLAAGASSQAGVASMLGRSWFTFVGRISYSWYLWHWPCLEFARRVAAPTPADEFAAPQATPLGAVLLAVAASFLLAVLTYALVEQPVRKWRVLARSRRLTFGLTAAIVGAAVAVPVAGITRVGGGSEVVAALAPPQAASEEVAGTSRTSQDRAGRTARGAQRTPMTPLEARADLVPRDGCFADFLQTAAPADCLFGDPDGSRTVVLLGDSHAAHWLPAMDELAKQRGWRLWFWAKYSCAYPGVPEWLESYRREYTECTTWQRAVFERVEALPKADAIVVGRSYPYLDLLYDGGRLDRAQAAPRWTEAATRTLTALREKSEHVVVLRDTPVAPEDVPACLSSNPKAPQRCAFPLGDNAHPDSELHAAERPALRASGAVSVDLTRVVCPSDPCSVLTPRGAIIFRDRAHLTSTFSREAAPALGKALAKYLPASEDS